jgi:hypothetical protein
MSFITAANTFSFSPWDESLSSPESHFLRRSRRFPALKTIDSRSTSNQTDGPLELTLSATVPYLVWFSGKIYARTTSRTLSWSSALLRPRTSATWALALNTALRSAGRLSFWGVDDHYAFSIRRQLPAGHVHLLGRAAATRTLGMLSPAVSSGFSWLIPHLGRNKCGSSE